MSGSGLDARLEFVAAHYRETFGHQREYIQTRDRLFIYALLGVTALAFRTSFADQSERVLTVIIEKLLGSGVQIDGNFLGVLLWFIFFALVARYFQATMNVERQYGYITRVEEEMTALYGKDLFAREGKQYLTNYPKFGAWMHLIYSWVFPLAVLLLSVWNAFVDISRRGTWSWTSTLVGIVAAFTVCTVLLYLYSTKFQYGAPWKKKQQSAETNATIPAPAPASALAPVPSPVASTPSPPAT